MGVGSLQLQTLPYPSTLLQNRLRRRFSSVSGQWHSASGGTKEDRQTCHPHTLTLGAPGWETSHMALPGLSQQASPWQ